MIKTILALCATMFLAGCWNGLSLQEVESSKQKCTDLGGTLYVKEWNGTVQAVKCMKDGFSYYDF